MRTLALGRTSVRLLRHHMVQYVGCGVVIAAAAVIATVEMVLFQALVLGEGIDWARLSNIETIQLRSQLSGLQVILMLMFLSAVGIALFLVFVGVKDVVMDRQRELATLRLVGAGRPQVRRLVAVETVAFSVLVAVPSAILGHILALPFYRFLQVIGVFGAQLQLNIGIYPLLAAAVVVMIATMSGTAAWFASREITNRPLLESLEPTASKTPKHRLVIRLAVFVGCLVTVGLLDPGRGGAVGQLALLVPLLVVVPLAALAPYLVPAVAVAVGRVLRLIFPGLALLVAQRARRDASRFARTIMPIMLAVGLLAGFYLGNAPDEALRAREYEQLLKADIVVSADSSDAANAVFAAAGTLANTTAGRFGESRSVIEVRQSKEPRASTFYFADFDALPQLLAFPVTEGSLSDVGGDRVASSRDGDRVGDVVDISRGAEIRQLHIVAVIATELYEGIFAAWSEAPILQVSPSSTKVLIKTVSPLEQLNAAIPIHFGAQLRVADRQAFVAEQIELRRANTSRGNIALFGTIYAMAIVSLFQSATTSGTSRRKEFELYRSLGLGNRNIVAIVLVESLVLSVVAAALLSLSVVALYLRFMGGVDSGIGALAFIPWPVIGTAFAAAIAIMCLASVGGTIYSLKARQP